MTPKQIEDSRKWTPRLVSASVVFSAGATVLWFFVSGWIVDIKNSAAESQGMIHQIQLQEVKWQQEVADNLKDHEKRLVLLEDITRPEPKGRIWTYTPH